MAQFLIAGSADEVPAIVDFEDAQVRSQNKCVRLGTIGVLTFRFVEDVELLDDRALLIGQEGPLRPQPGAKCCLDERWIRTYGHQLSVIHGQFVLKLHQLPHLLLIAWAKEPAQKDA